MGREIKFRGKRKDNGEWAYGDIWKYEGKTWIVTVINGEAERYTVDPETVGQYTGLKDEEETEIYDGDLCTDDGVTVLQVLWVESHHQWGVKVLKGSGTLSLGLTFPLWHWDDCKQNGYRKLKIIGNAFDNPELLEV